MNKEVKMDDIIDIMLEKLEAGGTVTFTPSGTSMLPMLRDSKDIVVLKKSPKRLKLFDVALYKRDNGCYVLHRVIGFSDDGTYKMCGDNQFAVECGIREDQIIAVLTSFNRKGKTYTVSSLRYRFYYNFWHYTRFFRHVFSFLKNRLGIKGKEKTSEEDYSYET